MQGAAAVLAAAATMPVYAQGTGKLRLGLLGCGKRGTGAIRDALQSAPELEVTAVADVFQAAAEGAREGLKRDGRFGPMTKITPETTFWGFDAYQKLVAGPVDVVLICTPPGFRPAQFSAAIEAGKHVFMEKPVGVDPVGIRKVLAAAELADQKKLNVVAGTQRRHHPAYQETIAKIHEGAIGDITSAAAYWIGDYDYYPLVKKKPEWSDMEWQLRNWNYFTWLSGDHIVEQHVHNLDVMNWLFKGPPVKAIGLGGRQQRTQPEAGHIYDHFAVEYEWPNGVKVTSMCRQMAKCPSRVSEWAVGTKGRSNCASEIWGENPFRSNKNVNPYVQEHTNLIQAIRTGKRINEGKNVAESTLTAILGRMCCYTGREIQYRWVMNGSKLDLMPKNLEFGAVEVPAVPIPGETELI